MGYQAKVQRIKRQNSEQWFINFPTAVAQAMEFTPSETMEWIIENKSQLVLQRIHTPPSPLKKKRQPPCANNSNQSGNKPEAPSTKKDRSSEPKA